MTHETTQSISDYGYISDCQTGALIGRNGSIDWYCPGRFDAPSIFGQILDPDAGHWSITPTGNYSAERTYLDNTMVLRTVFTTGSGQVALTDALLLAFESRGHKIGDEVPRILGRHLQVLSGSVELHMQFSPKMDYGLIRPVIERIDTIVRASACSVVIELESSVDSFEIGSGGFTGSFTLNAGEEASFLLKTRTESSSKIGSMDVQSTRDHLDDTIEGWRSWSELHHQWEGSYKRLVQRSALVLQALTYQPLGAIVAAPTTSLPGTPGGHDTWDYRYVWLRDLSLTMRALWVAACPDEASKFLQWLVQVNQGLLADGSDNSPPIMFDLDSRRDLDERTLDHLSGYQGNQPVRIGNGAWDQRQLDVMGEVIDTIYLFQDNLGTFDDAQRQFVIDLANNAARSWQLPDSGMWEARDKERYYLSSKVMCWVALDRAVKLAPDLGDSPPVDEWARARDAVRKTILEDGWSDKVEAFTGALGSDQLDASVLMMALVGFLPADDPRMKQTIETIASELAKEGLVHRWAGEPNGFLICTFWLVECLAMAGEHERAVDLFERTIACANDLGLMAEQHEVASGQTWGNFPQAFSHVGLINAAWRLQQTA